MNSWPKWVVCASVLCAFFVTTVQAEGPGGYGNLPYVWIHAGDYETEDIVLYDSHRFSWKWGDSPEIGRAYASGDLHGIRTANLHAS
ncbi:MAG: hypothetical protein JW959_14180 [Pirellulales bacterium]|nr:hypothetical protein [Pirellulales bacterium]